MASRVLSQCLAVNKSLTYCKNLPHHLTERQLIFFVRKKLHTCKFVCQNRKTVLGTSQEFYLLVSSFRIGCQREVTLRHSSSFDIMGKSQSRSYNIGGDDTVVRTKRYSRNQDTNGVDHRQSFTKFSTNEKSPPPSASVVAPNNSKPLELQTTKESSISETPQPAEQPQTEVTPQPAEQPQTEVTSQPTEQAQTEVTSQPTKQPQTEETSQTTEQVVSEEPLKSVSSEKTPESEISLDTNQETIEVSSTHVESQNTTEEAIVTENTVQESVEESVVDKSTSVADPAPEESEQSPAEDLSLTTALDTVQITPQSSGSDSVFITNINLDQTETAAAPVDDVLDTPDDTQTDTAAEVLTDTVQDTPSDLLVNADTPEVTTSDTLSDPPKDTPPEDSPPDDTPPDSEMSVVEQIVCDSDELKDGEMKECDVGDGKVLLVRDGDDFHAVSAKCTHYGAPLVKGVYCQGRIRCPWHGACFNVKTGDIEDFPGLDSLQKFDVEVSDGKVKVKAEKSALANHRRQRNMCKCSPDNNKTVLIIGGGPASVSCAETLRQEGYTGKVTIVTRESHLPYDRIQLSKNMGTTAAAIALRNEDFYKSHDIDIMTGKEATSVNTEDKNVSFQDGSTVPYDTLVLATGGQPRKIPIPGVDLENVCLLRTPGDANAIALRAQGKNVVIIGSSFIGMEVAAYLADNEAKSVSVVDLIKVPFQLTLGDKVGAALQKMHEDKGVKFYFERGIQSFAGEDGKVTKAILSDGTELEADICVLGIGVVPATKFLENSGLAMNKGGFLTVNKHMETEKPGVYAAGDIVNFPLFTCSDQEVNIQHWQMAHSHGRNVALNIVGKKTELKSVPYFWTVMYKKSIRYTGYGPGYDDVVFHGDDSKFVAFYTKGEDVVAVASLNFDPIVSQAAEFMCNGNKISKSEILEKPDTWTSRL